MKSNYSSSIRHYLLKYKSDVFYLLIVGFIGLIVFSPSFATALYGDEWKVLWLAKSAVDTKGSIFPTEVEDYPYLSEIAAFQFISNIVGYNGFYYYLFSFILRLLAGITLYWFLRQRKIYKFAAFIGSLLFIVSPIGIEATTWARNFDSYIGIIILLLGINTIILFKNKKSLLTLLLLFVSAIIINTTRSHGFLIVFTSMNVIQKLFAKKNQINLLLLSLFTMLVIFIIFSQTKLFGMQAGNFLPNPFPLKNFIYSFFGSYGRIFIPDFQGFQNFQQSFYIGAFALIALSITLTYFYYKKEKEPFLFLATTLLISISFWLIPIIRQPDIHASYDHRYIIFSALSVPMLISFILSKLKQPLSVAKKTTVFLCSLGVIIFYSSITYKYLEFHKTNHGNIYTETVWNQIRGYLDSVDWNKDTPEIVFLTEPGTYPKANATVSFGSMFHIGLIYKIWNTNKLPEVYLYTEKGEFENHLKKNPEKNMVILTIFGDKVGKLLL